jgi:HlyD family secretion protein
MKFKAKITLILIVVLALAAGVGYWVLGRDKATESSLIKGKIQRGTIRISVKATGTLEALRTVQVGSQISGQIAQLHADYNSVVKQGQLLAEIDPRTFQSQLLTEQAGLTSSQSRLQSAQADLLNQEANLVQAEANLKVAQVAAEQATMLYDRSKQLLDKGLVPASDNDVARTNAQSAAAKVSQAEAAIKSAQAQIRSRQAAIEQANSDIVGARAQLERAQINLDLTKIYSPVDGVVISRNVDIGQTVAASLSAPTLFLIANDLSHMQVKANIDEADIGKITNNVQVSFSVDAYRADQFTGKISEVRLEPQTVQNVVTYSVIVDVENPQLKLKPGMTANLTMIVDEHNDVLTAPNAALRFTPANKTQDEINELLKASAPPLPEPAPEASPAAPPVPVTKAVPSPDAGAGSGTQGGNRGGGGRGGGGRGGNRGGGGRGGQGNSDGNAAGTGFNAGNAGGNSGGNAGTSGNNRGGGNAGGNFSGGGGRGGGGRGGGGQGRPQRAILWVEESPGVLKPIQVRTGLTDGTRTEVSGANIMEGTEVVMSDISQTTTAPAARPATNSPLVPQVGGRGRGGF